MENGGDLVQAVPLLTADGKRVLVGSGGRVKVYDGVKDGQLLECHTVSEESRVTGLALNGPSTVLASLENGHIMSLDLATGTSTCMMKLDRGIKKIIPFDTGILAVSMDGLKMYQIVLSPSRPPRSFTVVKSGKAINAFACTADHVAYACGRRLCIWDVKEDPGRKAVQSVEMVRSITSMVWCGKDLVTGHSNGAMAIFRNCSSKTVGTAKSQDLHWHSDAVRCMASSSLDGHVLTGAHEGVAVLWSVETGKQQFWPRLGSSIIHASASADKWILSTADNALHVLASSTFSTICTIRGIAGKINHGILCQSPHDQTHVLVGGPTGTIQLYDTLQDRSIAILQISKENVVTGLPEDTRPIDHSHVTLLALHGKDRMATVETRLPSTTLTTLRLWAFEAGAYTQSLVTDNPHGAGVQVTAVSWISADRLVTADSKGNVRLWVCSPSGHWAGSSKQNVSLHGPISSISVSPDTSVLALSSGPLIILLDPSTLSIVSTLCNTKTGQSVSKVSFVGEFLAAYGSDDCLTVWSLTSLSPLWSLNGLHITAMVSRESSFAVAISSPTSNSSYVLLFDNPASPIPSLARRHKASIHGLAYAAQSIMAFCTTSLQPSNPIIMQAFPEDQPIPESLLPRANTTGGSTTKLASSILENADRASDHLLSPSPSAQAPQWNLKQASPADRVLHSLPSHALPSMRMLYAAFAKLRLSPPPQQGGN